MSSFTFVESWGRGQCRKKTSPKVRALTFFQKVAIGVKMYYFFFLFWYKKHYRVSCNEKNLAPLATKMLSKQQK